MPVSVSMSRAVVGSVLLVGLLVGSGCSWFRKGDKLYGEDVASRPLEVPPELEVGAGAGAGAAAAGSVTASDMGAPATPAAVGSANGFIVPGTRDAVFAKVGSALEQVEGLSIASRAQLLGAFDVNYGGSNFLVRVSAADAGAYVSAVDPRGLPASGEAPVKLVAALKAALGGN